MTIEQDYEKTGNLLLGAADLIREQGWIQCEYSSPRGFCLVGSIRELADPWLSIATPSFEDQNRCYDEGQRAIRVLTEALEGASVVVSNDVSVVTWNDMLGRKEQDAIDLLEYAAGVCFEKAGVS